MTYIPIKMKNTHIYLPIDHNTDPAPWLHKDQYTHGDIEQEEESQPLWKIPKVNGKSPHSMENLHIFLPIHSSCDRCPDPEPQYHSQFEVHMNQLAIVENLQTEWKIPPMNGKSPSLPS